MQIATTLLNYGAETNILTKQAVTPLHLASQEGHADMVNLLLEKGANIHVATKVAQSFNIFFQCHFDCERIGWLATNISMIVK